MFKSNLPYKKRIKKGTCKRGLMAHEGNDLKKYLVNLYKNI